jgi:hypothetical protein
MNAKLLRGSWIILFWLIPFLLLPYPTLKAQGSLNLSKLLVEVWPEYDRPETLVIYRGELDPTIPLPAGVTFRLPGYIQDMHAVAAEQDGQLVDVNPNAIELRREGEELLLTFTTPSPRFQFEYYDPLILTKQEQTRQLNFEFIAPAEIESTTFEVQEPVGTQNFALTPPPDNSFVGADGLRYNTIAVAGLKPGDAFTLTLTYQRDSNQLSIDRPETGTGLTGPPASRPVELGRKPETLLGEQSFLLGYILIGAGVILLGGTGVYWWWSTRRSKELGRRRPPRRSLRPKPVSSIQKQPRQTSMPAPEQVTSYCYRCGAPLRPDANFCHVCGAERRSD